MEISSRDANGVVVVELDGNLDTNTSPAAQEFLDGLIDGGSGKILVSFEKLNYVSSAGLRVLLATARKMKAQGGDLRLCSLNQIVQDVFEISGFSSILSIHVDEADALREF